MGLQISLGHCLACTTVVWANISGNGASQFVDEKGIHQDPVTSQLFLGFEDGQIALELKGDSYFFEGVAALECIADECTACKGGTRVQELSWQDLPAAEKDRRRRASVSLQHAAARQKQGQPIAKDDHAVVEIGKGRQDDTPHRPVPRDRNRERGQRGKPRHIRNR